MKDWFDHRSYFSATKVRWILDHVEGAQERAEKRYLWYDWCLWFGNWLTVQLTWRIAQIQPVPYFIADKNSNGMMRFWKSSTFPKAIPEVRSFWDLRQDTPFHSAVERQFQSMAGDQQAAPLRSVAFEPGMVKNTYGTEFFHHYEHWWRSAVVLKTTFDNDWLWDQQQGLLCLGRFLSLSQEVPFSARDGLRMVEEFTRVWKYTLHSHNNDEVIIFSFTGHKDTTGIKMLVVGLWSAFVEQAKKTLSKATLRSIAYQVRDIIDTMQSGCADSYPSLEGLDGGISSFFLTVSGWHFGNRYARY